MIQTHDSQGRRIYKSGGCEQCNYKTALRIDENNQPNLFGKYVRCQHCGSIWEPFWWVPEEKRDEYQQTHCFNRQTNNWEVRQ